MKSLVTKILFRVQELMTGKLTLQQLLEVQKGVNYEETEVKSIPDRRKKKCNAMSREFARHF